MRNEANNTNATNQGVTMETITVKGIAYQVTERRTADIEEAAGRPNTAQMMRDNNSQNVLCRRPRGRKTYWFVEFTRKYGRLYNLVGSF